MVVRGATQFKPRANQGRDFTGLRYGNITPTDIDGLIEYQDKCYVFLEAKLEGTSMPHGQELALVRLCDDVQRVKPSILILATHNTAIGREIDFANAFVEKYRYMGEWRVTSPGTTVKQLVDNFIARKG